MRIWINPFASFAFFIALTVVQKEAYSQMRFSDFYDFHNGADALLDVEPLSNGSFAIVGTTLNLTDNVGAYEGIHLKISLDGEIQQEHRYGLSQHNYNTRALIKSNYSESSYTAGYYCDFSIESLGYCDFYLSKLDGNMDTVYTNVISRPDTGDVLLNLVETKPNRLMLIGWTYNDTTNANADILLITLDTLGNEVNRVVYGGGGTDYIHSGIVINEVGEVIMTGYTKSFGGSANGRTWTIKTDSIGNVLWQKVYSGDANNGTGIGICRSSDGNLVISGGNNGSGNGSDGMLLKIDTEGNEIWTKRYQVPNGQGLWGVVGLDDGTIVSCGVTDDGNDQAGWLIKTDENGDTLWTRTYDPSDATDYLRNMLVMPNGDIVMVGFGRGENSTTQDGWILRVDSMGCVVENCFLTSVNEELGIKS